MGGVALAVGALAAGIALYAWKAPSVDIVKVELGGSAQHWPLPHGTTTAVWWDFALIAGYGTALVASLLLARAVFWTSHACNVARLGLALAVTAVTADVVENVFLIAAGHAHRNLLDLATGAAVVKFSSLLPAAVIALVGLATTVTRLILNRAGALEKRKNNKIAVVPSLPLTTNDADLLAKEGVAAPAVTDTAAADRWRLGYHVPGETDPVKGAGVGICLSGGGVRSASVALGAMQSLRSELQEARYLVSVSGGGYTAGALQLALTNAGDAKQSDKVIHDSEHAFAPGSVEEDWVRRHADYLASKPSELFSAFGVVARGMLLSLLVLFGPALVLGVAFGRAWKRVPLAPYDAHALNPLKPLAEGVTYPAVRTGTWYGLAALVALAVVAYAVSIFVAAKRVHGWREMAKLIASVALVVAAISVGLPSLVYVSALALHHFNTTRLAFGGPAVTLLLTYGTLLVSLSRNKRVKSATTGLFKRGGATVGAVPGGALQLVFVIVTLALLAAGWLLLLGGMAAIADSDNARTVALVVLGAVIVLGFAVDQIWLSLHPFYRRRLAGAFATRRIVRNGAVVAKGYEFSEPTTLSEYGKRPSGDGIKGFPEVVFAATANLSGEKIAPLNAVPYTFSGEWVGGPDLGYMKTSDLCGAVSSRLCRDLTVEAAVAISGAAFASSMGRAGRWYSTLFAVTGLRLGSWLPNPRFVRERNIAIEHDDWTMPELPRNRRLPSLLQEVFRVHPERGPLLHITDGGHYENLGLVELFRRRCTKIYCIDASGDSPPTAGTLEEALTLAWSELGVTVLLDEILWKTSPGTGKPYDPAEVFAALNQRLSKRAVVEVDFLYEPGSDADGGQLKGTLIFAKTLLTHDMPYGLLSYAARNGIFPRDSTGDQFFDDGKFCGYRALGAELGVIAAQPAAPAAQPAPAAPEPAPTPSAGGDMSIAGNGGPRPRRQRRLS